MVLRCVGVCRLRPTTDHRVRHLWLLFLRTVHIAQIGCRLLAIRSLLIHLRADFPILVLLLLLLVHTDLEVATCLGCDICSLITWHECR